MTIRFTVLVGNPKAHSRTRSATLYAASQLRCTLSALAVAVDEPRVVDLAGLGPHFVGARPRSARALREATRAVCGARLLLVGSPTFKGTFTGLLKIFIESLPPDALRGKVAVPLMTAASPAHRHAVDSYLSPLLATLGAAVTEPGLSILTSELPMLDTIVGDWLHVTGPWLGEQLRYCECESAMTAEPPGASGRLTAG